MDERFGLSKAPGFLTLTTLARLGTPFPWRHSPRGPSSGTWRVRTAAHVRAASYKGIAPSLYRRAGVLPFKEVR